ncbi:MAG: methylated-DNA--[protein]-cysteine S-methyltransferase [Proteobacteria bacterium]|nr:methylated-DNA--[protein]-cysteine S-methyltransferase [Pseudomonadota bacterium]
MFARKHIETKLGWMTIETTNEAVTKISFGKTGIEIGLCPIADQASQEIVEYMAGERTQFSVKMAPRGTDFQKKVWDALKKIPYGVFPSYSDIAAAIGKPTATRAVGMANNKNPIPIMIPCHRVIGRNGDLTGYAGGIPLKKKLLDLELRS